MIPEPSEGESYDQWNARYERWKKENENCNHGPEYFLEGCCYRCGEEDSSLQWGDKK